MSVGLLTVLYFGNQLLNNAQDNGLPATILEKFAEKNTGFNKVARIMYPDYEENMYRVTVEDYYNQCHAPSWQETNMATTQIKCSVLDGVNVNWEGYVTEVKLKSVKNSWNNFVQFLPAFLQEYVKCYYGEEFSSLCHSAESPRMIDECSFMQNVARHTGKSCHLNNFNELVWVSVLY